jgi:hypothetical protein
VVLAETPVIKAHGAANRLRRCRSSDERARRDQASRRQRFGVGRHVGKKSDWKKAVATWNTKEKIKTDRKVADF